MHVSADVGIWMPLSATVPAALSVVTSSMLVPVSMLSIQKQRRMSVGAGRSVSVSVRVSISARESVFVLGQCRCVCRPVPIARQISQFTICVVLSSTQVTSTLHVRHPASIIRFRPYHEFRENVCQARGNELELRRRLQSAHN